MHAKGHIWMVWADLTPSSLQWISGFTQARSNFTLKLGTGIASATAYASGVGCYAMTVNGLPVAPEPWTYLKSF